LIVLLALLSALLASRCPPAAWAETASLDEVLSAIVRIKTHINPEGRTVETLGYEREGSGIVIDKSGLVLTIGYLMVEAQSAEVFPTEGSAPVPAAVLGYDHDTGFGLLRTNAPLKVRPLEFGKSSELKVGDRVLAASFGGRAGLAPAFVVAKREFAGSWEYLLDETIFTAPAHSHWSGAALISQDGKLVGVGSLIIADTTGRGDGIAGNMYVPIDLLPPILGELLANGRVQGPARPWLGLTTEEIRGRLFVSRVAQDGPAQKAGMEKGDIIVGVAGQTPASLADFYRKVWAQGSAGTTVPLDVLHGNEVKRIEVKSINRLDHLRLKSSF
jgi:S1-C subfamily serine protease